MHNNRKIFVFLCICLAFAGLFIRLFYLQIIQGNKLSKAASVQRVTNSILQKPRGNILDRQGIPLTCRNKKVLVIVKPLYLRGREDEIKRICEILEIDFNKIRREIEIKKEPIIVEADEIMKQKIINSNIHSISVVNYLERYNGSTLARHVLGYLNSTDETGETGIEKSYESELRYDKKSTVGVITDAKNNPLEGLGYRLIKDADKGKKLNVKLTLDYHIQKIVESVMDKNSMKGAVVVENVNNGDIVAMASKPDFDPNNIGGSLNSPDKELFNKAVASYNMGSIFKIIDAAQAIESNMDLNAEYYCSGSIKLGNKMIRCHKEAGHGWVDMTKAFASSCNTYFIDLAIKTGYKDILGMAKKFGLSSPTGINKQGINESAGMLPPEDVYFSNGDTANLAIGQGKVMVTPLQVADIVATVANGGIKNKVNIVDSIVDDMGNKVRGIKNQSGTRIISKDTADLIKSMMEEVVVSGTGTKANLEEYGGSGGKTGSAETGQLIDGQNVVQAWFAGYFPKTNPKYSIAVFVENGKMGNEAAAPIFKEIGEEILKKEY